MINSFKTLFLNNVHLEHGEWITETFDYIFCLGYNNRVRMNSFSIGDKVIYPTQGICVIEDIQEENYYGEDFHIYHVRLLSNYTLILVPASNTEEIGIRRLITPENIDKVFHFMRNGSVDVTMNWKGRYKEHLNLLKTGAYLDMALVLKSLFYLNLIKPLSFREKKMLERVKELLVAEISEVCEDPFDFVEKQLYENLSFCFKNISSQVDS